MTDEKEFEAMDQEWCQRLKTAGKPKVPEAMTRDFAAAVENKILEGSRPFLPLAVAVPAFLLTFAFVAGFIFWFWHARLQPAQAPRLEGAAASSATVAVPVAEKPARKLEKPVPAETPASMAMTEKDLASEIAVLRELGVWSEEDERAIGISLEDDLTDLEWLGDATPSVEFSPKAAL